MLPTLTNSKLTLRQRDRLELVARELSYVTFDHPGIAREVIEHRLKQQMPDLFSNRLTYAVNWILQRRGVHISENTKDVPREKKNAKRAKKIMKMMRKKAAETWTPDLPTMPYPLFLKTKYWHLIRTIVLTRAGHQCESCSRKYKLQVHHLDYTYRGKEHEHTDHLKVLCDRCHKDTHHIR